MNVAASCFLQFSQRSCTLLNSALWSNISCSINTFAGAFTCCTVVAAAVAVPTVPATLTPTATVAAATASSGRTLI